MNIRNGILISSLTLLGITSSNCDAVKERVLACNMNALSREQRARQVGTTAKLIAVAKRTETKDAYILTVDRARVSPAELAEWVANETRCCPAVDFQLDLPASGPLTVRLGGGPEVKAFLASELNLIERK